MELRQLDAALTRLQPYARALLDRSRRFALQIHADELGPEHLLVTLMEDEDCAAHRVALHAFADPESIADESRSLAAGITISGSARALPFSPHGVRALRAARAHAVRRRDAVVEVAHLLLAAHDELDDDLRSTFEDAGWNSAGVEQLLGSGGPGGVDDSGQLFHCFSDDAKRLLSSAAKLARSTHSASISAAHLLLVALQTQARFERAAGMPASRARLALRGRLEDDSLVEGRPLEADEALEACLASLPPAADTLTLLASFHGGAARELQLLLTRHKVTTALIERSRGAFSDPA